MAARRHPRGEARHAGASAADVSLAPGGRCAALCRAALRAPAGALSCAAPDTPTAATEDAGSLGCLAAGGGGAAARLGSMGRPALGRPLDAGVPGPGARPGAHGADADPADVSPGVAPALGPPGAGDPGHPQPLRAYSDRDHDYPPYGW